RLLRSSAPMRTLLAAVTVAALGYLHWQAQRPVDPGPGAVAPRPPLQRALADARPLSRDGFTLRPLAHFEAEARVLGRQDYGFDTESALSPTDLALGWGRMSDANVLAGLEIRQGGRWYHYSWRSAEPPIPLPEIIRSSANMHFIPASDEAADALAAVREGQVVRFRGLLVEASRADGWHWRSSLSRDDSGGGACELVWLERIEAR
ncbi:MAG: hypothetical protein ACK59R_06060, partial [Pseudomonadota bacterium]